MLIDVIINFCILFTFAILIYIPFQNRLNIYIPSSKYTPFILGILSGFTGCLLMLTSINISDVVIMDGRMAVIALSGVLGGPFATIISGTIIGVFRIFMYEYSTSALIASSTIIAGLIIGIWSWKRAMTFQNVSYFFGYSIIQTSLVIGFLGNWTFDTWVTIMSFILYSIISFSIIYFILKQLRNLFEKIDVSYPFGGIASRNGGEEFSVLLPNTANEKSLEIAHLIGRAIESNVFQVSSGEKLNITISGGISTFPQNAVTLHDLYKLADEALYLAKTTGRNKIVHTN